jgi:uncharacterized membrane protein YdjX (TVP38/TMEM64 family)
MILSKLQVSKQISKLRNRKLWYFLALLVLVTLTIRYLSAINFADRVDDWIKSLGFWGMPAFGSVYVVLSVLAVPRIALILIAGTIFGLIDGIITVSISDVLGASACYVVGRTIAIKHVQKLKQKFPRLEKLDQILLEKGWQVLLLSRLSPIIPSNISNYGFSCTNVNFGQYIFFTWLGMLPVIIYYVNLGYFGSSLLGGGSSPEKICFQAIGLIATVLTAIYTNHLAKEVLSER